MEDTLKITLSLTREEMNLLHSALCDYRGKLGNLMGQMGCMGLATEEAQALWNQLGDLSGKMCDMMAD